MVSGQFEAELPEAASVAPEWLANRAKWRLVERFHLLCGGWGFRTQATVDSLGRFPLIFLQNPEKGEQRTES